MSAPSILESIGAADIPTVQDGSLELLGVVFGFTSGALRDIRQTCQSLEPACAFNLVVGPTSLAKESFVGAAGKFTLVVAVAIHLDKQRTFVLINKVRQALVERQDADRNLVRSRLAEILSRMSNEAPEQVIDTMLTELIVEQQAYDTYEDYKTRD